EARVVDLSSEDGTLYDIAWRVSDGASSVELDTRHRSAPPKVVESGELALGVACYGTQLAVIADHTVSVWSLENGRSLWSQTLPRRYRARGDATKTRDGLVIRCDALRVKRGKLRVPTRGGRVELDLRRGVVVD